MHRRACVTASIYARNGEIAQDENGSWTETRSERVEAIRFLGTFLADGTVGLPPATVIDVGWIAGRGWSVIEANGMWGAGIYGCDPLKVLGILPAGLRPYAK